MFPFPQVVPWPRPPGNAGVVVTALLVATWWWLRRLTVVPTPWQRRRWQQRLDRQPDGFEREAIVGFWAAMADGLLGGSIRRRAVRAERAALALRCRESEARAAHAAAMRAREALSAQRARHPERRRVIHPLVAVVLSIGALGADVVFVSNRLAASNDSFLGIDALVLAVPLSLTLFLAGRLVGRALADGKRVPIAGGCVLAATVGAAVLSGPSEGASSPTQLFVIVLAPAAVSAIAVFLAHPEPVEVESAVRAERRSRAVRWWRTRQLERALRRAGAARVALDAEVARRLVTRAQVSLDGVEAPIRAVGSRTLLGELEIGGRPAEIESVLAFVAEVDAGWPPPLTPPPLGDRASGDLRSVA